VGIVVARDAVGLAGYLGIALILAGTAWGRSIEERHRREVIAWVATPGRDRHQTGVL
jgi:hypothetical protein